MFVFIFEYINTYIFYVSILYIFLERGNSMRL